MASRCLGPHYREDLLRAFFSDFPCVASPFCVFGIAAESPPSLRDGDLLCPHRSPYCLRVRSLGKLTEKCSSTSPLVIRPPRPLPCNWDVSTPFSSISFAAAG